MERIREDAYSNIEELKDVLVEVLDYNSYSILLDYGMGVTVFDKDDIVVENDKVSVSIPLEITKFDKLPKNKDARNVISNAIETLYDNAREGMWRAFANPSERFKYFGYADLEDYGVTKESDITNEIIDDIAKRIDSKDPDYVIDNLSWESSNTHYSYDLLIEASFRTFRGTDSVDVILNMYITKEEIGSNRKEIVVDSYEPEVFGFTTDIVKGKDEDGTAYQYLDSMLDDVTKQF